MKKTYFLVRILIIYLIFISNGFAEIHKKANKYFKKVVKYKPLPSRRESKEIYIYCKGISKSFNFPMV